MGQNPKKAAQKRVGRPRKPDESDHEVEMPVGSLDVAMDSGVNAGLWSNHVDNVNTVMEHQLFQDLATQEPVGINAAKGQASGGQAVFDVKQAKVALKGSKRYMCSINVAWLNAHYTPCPKVPIMQSSVAAMQEHYFSKPAGFTSKIAVEIPVLANQIDDAAFWQSRGQWRHTSPDEILIAFYAAVAASVRNKDVTGIDAWHHHMLTVAAEFIVVDTEADIDWRSVQLREDIQANTTLARTAVQRIWDINLRRKSLPGKVTPQQIFELYDAKVKQAQNNPEQVTLSFCDMAFTVWDRALCEPQVQKIVLEEEALRHGSIFNSVTRLQLIVSKATTQANIIWAFEMLQDLRRSGLLSESMLSNRSLDGKLKDQGGKGLIEAICYKKMLLAHFLGTVLPASGLSNTPATLIREACVDVPTFRKKLGSNGECACGVHLV